MLTPTDEASQRTKNRLREHSLVKQVSTLDHPPHMKFHTLFRCRDSECKWIGWLPNNEFSEET